MADKTEELAKRADIRLGILERAHEGMKKPLQDVSSLTVEIKQLSARLTKLEAAVEKLTSLLDTKVDKKTAEQLEQARTQKAQAADKKQAVEWDLMMKKLEKQQMKEAAAVTAQVHADVAKMQIDQRLAVLETRIKSAEGRLK